MRNYNVILDKAPKHNDYAADFFPRGFHYKKDAIDLVVEVKQKGGVAHVEDMKGKRLRP